VHASTPLRPADPAGHTRSTAESAASDDDLVSALGEELLTTILRLKRIGSRVLDEWHTSVTMPQLAVLGRLHSCGPQRLSTIADWSQLDRSSASRQLTELTDRGLVERLDDPQDGRARLLQLTDLGSALLARVVSQRNAFFRQALRTWSDADIAELHLLLHRLNDDVGDTVAPEVDAIPT
jgi:DNA-binding MarR family transcriptional regulator